MQELIYARVPADIGLMRGKLSDLPGAQYQALGMKECTSVVQCIHAYIFVNLMVALLCSPADDLLASQQKHPYLEAVCPLAVHLITKYCPLQSPYAIVLYILGYK